jgi:hypothetical protein
VELYEFHVLIGKAGTGDHGSAITGASMGSRAREVGATISTGKDETDYWGSMKKRFMQGDFSIFSFIHNPRLHTYSQIIDVEIF